MSEPPIFREAMAFLERHGAEALEDVLQREVRDHQPHRHYDHSSHPVALPQEETTMSLATIEADAEQALGEVTAFVRTKLPAAVADAKKLEPVLSSNLVEALLGAVHVPVGAIEDLIIPTINWLATAYPKDDTTTAAPADPAMGTPPAPAAAPAA